MAKHKENTHAPKQPKQPKLTHGAFLACMWAIVLGLIAQLVMAIAVYPFLPEGIPASWAGSPVPYNVLPAWIVFLWFPAAQSILLILAMFSPRDEQGRRAMESGEAATLILLALLFTALQASAFHIPYYGS